MPSKIKLGHGFKYQIVIAGETVDIVGEGVPPKRGLRT